MKILKPGHEPEKGYVGRIVTCGYCKCQFEIEARDRIQSCSPGVHACDGYDYVKCPSCREECQL